MRHPLTFATALAALVVGFTLVGQATQSAAHSGQHVAPLVDVSAESAGGIAADVAGGSIEMHDLETPPMSVPDSQPVAAPAYDSLIVIADGADGTHLLGCSGTTSTGQALPVVCQAISGDFDAAAHPAATSTAEHRSGAASER